MATDDRPRSLQYLEEIAHRRMLLSEPHMKPLETFVKELRSQNYGEVPDFDPLDGGINAQALFLYEKPGPKANVSGFISRNNNDRTAENSFNFMERAKIPRKQTCIWNVIPGWNGTIKTTSVELREGIASLQRLLVLLPRLSVVVFVGNKAERARSQFENSNLALLRSYHPSPKNQSLAPDKWNTIPAQWSHVIDYLTL